MDKILIEQIKEVIIEAGLISLDLRSKGLEITYKSDKSPVTNADKKISYHIFSALSRITPQIPVICEERESPTIIDSDLFWLVDPIDGTKSYIRNDEIFTINIALIEKGKPVVGFVHLPSQSRLYFTDKNSDLVIEVDGKVVVPRVHDKLGFVAVVSSHNFNPSTQDYLNYYNFDEILAVPSSYKLCMVAEGLCDVYPKFGETMEWDIAAGDAILRAAGGAVYTTRGSIMLYGKETLINPHFIAASSKWLKSNKLS